MILATAAAIGVAVAFGIPPLRDAIKLLGASYLVFLGVKTWRAAPAPIARATEPTASPWRDYRLGLMTNLANPKSVLFFASVFAALLPPEVPVSVKIGAVVLIGLNATWWHVSVAIAFARPAVRRGYARAKTRVDRVVGSVLVAIGVRVVVEG